MIKTMIKKAIYCPFEYMSSGIIRVMFDRQNMMEDIRDEKGEPTGEHKETDYCVVSMEIFYYKPSADYMANLLMSSVKYVNMEEAQAILSNLEEDTTEHLRAIMLHNVKSYDVSENVNQFTIQGKPMWLPKSDRVGLQMRFQAEKEAGKSETTLWTGDGASFTLGIDTALSMLYSLEGYASKCYDKTMAHVAAVKALENKEAIMAYDYTTGYPEKLSF